MIERFRCPSCDRAAGIPVLRGMPTFAAIDAEGAGLVRTSGCVIMPGMRNTACTACDHAWDVPARAHEKYLQAIVASEDE